VDMWRVLQGGHVEGLTGWTGAPVEVPPVLKKRISVLFLLNIIVRAQLNSIQLELE
jgi:hypothetical protein